jgi:hypothetical protein
MRENVVVILLVAAAVALVGRHLYRKAAGRDDEGCQSCPRCGDEPPSCPGDARSDRP